MHDMFQFAIHQKPHYKRTVSFASHAKITNVITAINVNINMNNPTNMNLLILLSMLEYDNANYSNGKKDVEIRNHQCQAYVTANTF